MAIYCSCRAISLVVLCDQQICTCELESDNTILIVLQKKEVWVKNILDIKRKGANKHKIVTNTSATGVNTHTRTSIKTNK